MSPHNLNESEVSSMSISARTLAMLILASAAALAGVWFVSSRSRISSNAPPDAVEELWRAGREMYAKAPVLPLTEETAGLAVQACPTAAGRSSARPEQVAALRTAMTEFISHRFLSESPETYIAWRSAQGAKAKALDAMFVNDGLGQLLRYYDLAEYPAEQSWEHIFGKVWAASASGAGGGKPQMIVGVAANSSGAEIAFSSMSRRWPNMPELSEVWLGSRSGGGRNWFEGVDVRSIMAGEASTLVAVAVVLVEFADKSRRPLRCVFAWDESLRVWALLDAGYVGYVEDPIRVLEY
jgi:hypothetical protein